jgi:periplasmic divalent cation tolerance protein
MSYYVVITTCGNRDEAERLASQIIEKKLAACVQLSSITSYYIWEGEVNNDPEIKLLIKTRKELYDQLEKLIKDNHSYDVPEIIALPVQSGSKDYLDWIEEVTI